MLESKPNFSEKKKIEDSNKIETKEFNQEVRRVVNGYKVIVYERALNIDHFPRSSEESMQIAKEYLEEVIRDIETDIYCFGNLDNDPDYKSISGLDRDGFSKEEMQEIVDGLDKCRGVFNFLG